MKKYFAKSVNMKSIELFEGEKYVGKLIYPKWYSYNVSLESENGRSEIKTEDFWLTKMVHYNAQQIKIRELKITWKGFVVKETFGEEYFLSAEGFWNFKFVLKSRNEKILMTVNYKTSWKKMTLDYEIDVDESLDKDNDFILAVLHGINYHMQMYFASGSA